MQLPNAEHAFVDLRKLTEYCLSPTHPIGKDKALVFKEVLGLTIDDAEFLRAWLLRVAAADEAVAGKVDEFGERFQIDFEASTCQGHVRVRSTWIIRIGEGFPRLTSCYVLSK